MELAEPKYEFVIIGENIHTTRVLLRKGKLVTTNPDGLEAVRFYDVDKRRRYLLIPKEIRRTQDYEEGRVKYVKIAIQAAMFGHGSIATDGLAYLHRMVQRQIDAGADYLDLQVDEISLRNEDQKQAMQWLVEKVEQISTVPLSLDSSDIEILKSGLETCRNRRGKVLLNSASLERLEVLDLAREFNCRVIVTASGESGMPQNSEERIKNASRMVESALAKKIEIQDIFIDPLVFPISVDAKFGNHCLDAIRWLRKTYGPEIHITGGFSNVSFGIPCRRLVNDVFTILAIEAGADSGIIDPTTGNPLKILSMPRTSVPYQLAEAMLLGRDMYCKTFLRAFRNGDLRVS